VLFTTITFVTCGIRQIFGLETRLCGDLGNSVAELLRTRKQDVRRAKRHLKQGWLFVDLA
jgi:hypothetical protein